ncbi:MAG TPA: hypothetical protein VEN81_07960 [Planctomycetota bacterium]|jgi:hypothetical protein|nr:hypothetical protein [Planctomycetota bacterium]
MAETPGAVGPSDLDFYRMIRARLEHEDGLMVNRLSWLVASQAFLFTAYAIAQNGPQAAAGHPPALVRVVPMVGIASVALIYAGLLAAVRAMGWLRSALRARIPDESRIGLPGIHTPGSIRAAGLAAPVVLPIVFLLAWVVLVMS